MFLASLFCPAPLRSTAVPAATTDIRHLTMHVTSRQSNHFGYNRFRCRIFKNATEAAKGEEGDWYMTCLSERDIDPAKLRKFLAREVKETKETRHCRAAKKDIPFKSGEEFALKKKALKRLKKRNDKSKTDGNEEGSKAPSSGTNSPLHLQESGFKKREPALLDLIGASSAHSFARTQSSRRDTLKAFAKKTGVSSDIFTGWVEWDEALQIQRLSQRQVILTHQFLCLACGFVKFGCLENGPSQLFYNSKS